MRTAEAYGWTAITFGSLVMAVAKTALQSAVMVDPRPGEVLTYVNQVISRLNIDQFVTAACCLMDAVTGRAVLALAGHPWPVWYRAAGQSLGQPGEIGLPLGVDAEARYDLAEIEMGLGDALVFYTDGVVEAFAADRSQYGLDRLKEQVRKHGHCEAGAILAAIRRDLASHRCDECPVDDVALLAVKTTGRGEGGEGGVTNGGTG